MMTITRMTNTGNTIKAIRRGTRIDGSTTAVRPKKAAPKNPTTPEARPTPPTNAYADPTVPKPPSPIRSGLPTPIPEVMTTMERARIEDLVSFSPVIEVTSFCKPLINNNLRELLSKYATC